MIGIRNPSSTDKERGIQYLDYGIQNCLGFPYIGQTVACFAQWIACSQATQYYIIFRSIRILDYLIIEINVQALLKIFL